jgi:dimethylaniline monooxygenase (N-oxide forming)
MMKDYKQKHVIVIGAGPSGLAATKELLEKGHKVTCFEKSGLIGGAFADGTAYDTCYLTASNLLMAYSDFPPKDGTIRYSTKHEYYNYLKDYATHFKLWDSIQFNAEVVNAKIDKTTGNWIVKTEISGKKKEYTSDAMIVATGSNRKPNIIDLPGYTGEVSHSVDYRGPEAFKGMKVLVVGVGESSSDITTEVAEVADVTVWSRRHGLIAPRYLSIMEDPEYDESELLRTQDKRTDKISNYLETITTNRIAGWLPGWYYAFLRQEAVWKNKKTSKGEENRIGFLGDWCRLASEKELYFRADQAGIATKNGSLAVAHALGKMDSVVSKTATFEGKKVTFPNTIWYNETVDECEKSTEFDHVLLCTGYKTDFSWLEVDFDWSPRSWYKHCFPAGPAGDLGEKLMFLGWTRPHQGGIPICSEILSRYIAMILSDERELPKDFPEIAKREGNSETNYYVSHSYVPVIVDLPAFMESMAAIIGCTPTCPSIFNLERFGQYWLYPSWSFFYRQHGPGAKAEVLEQVMKELPLSEYFEIDGLTMLGLPMAVGNLLFSLLIRCIPLVSEWYRTAGLKTGYLFLLPRKHVLHGNHLPPVNVGFQVLFTAMLFYYLFGTEVILGFQRGHLEHV